MVMANVRQAAQSTVKKGLDEYEKTHLIVAEEKHRYKNIKELAQRIIKKEPDLKINHLAFSITQPGVDFKIIMTDGTRTMIITTQFYCLNNPEVKPDYMFLIK